MAFREIVKTMEFPEGATERYKRLNAFRRLLDNVAYDDIDFDFSTEQINGEYLTLLKRRPSAPYNLARIVVDQSSGLLWGGEQMPFIDCGRPEDELQEDGKTEDPAGKEKRQRDRSNVESIVTNCVLDAVMMEAYESAAPGSSAIVVRADAERSPSFTIVAGEEAFPVYDPFVPGKLITLSQVYPTTAKKLRDAGIVLSPDDNANGIFGQPDDADTYWVRIDFTQTSELRYKPMSGERYSRLGTKEWSHGVERVVRWQADKEYPHAWGVVPAIWCRNLVGGPSGPDGRCTYGDIVDMQVEIAYLLSQIGRGYRYTADPLLVRKRGELMGPTVTDIDPLGEVAPPNAEMIGEGGATVRSASNVIEVGANGDAKLLETTGAGLKAAGDHVKQLREWALEVVGAMKADASTTKGASSGRAIELLYEALQLLLKRQRIAFGTKAFVPLVRLLLHGVAVGAIDVDDVADVDPNARLSLKWPQWLKPRGQDLLATVNAYEIAIGGSAKEPKMLVTQPRGTAALAAELGYTDPNALAREVEEAQEEADEAAQEQAEAEKAHQLTLATAKSKTPTNAGAAGGES